MLTTLRAQAREQRHVELPTGGLDIAVDDALWPLDDLCDFAARNNPRRGFLIVSRVLGRHLPTSPLKMRQSARDLADQIPGDLPGPVMVIGLAETAICLGQTVHQELRARTGRHDIFFLHTTRQQLDHPLLCRFEEPHSHASAHLLYQPAYDGFAAPRSVVLVDDEISTGTTLANLAAALIGCWPGVETITVAALTDWSSGAWLEKLPRPAQAVALLRGSLRWTPRPGIAAPVSSIVREALGRLERDGGFGRLGLRDTCESMPAQLPDSSAPLRILGTGEFTFLPFLLAERLQQSGRDVVVQATSRSPVRLGGAIGKALTFHDNYGAEVPNHLYNAGVEDGRKTWICHETPSGSVDPALLSALAAKPLAWPA